MRASHLVFTAPLATIAFTLALCLTPAPSVAATRKTVLDHYLALPDAFFACEAAPSVTTASKRAHVATLDVANGYLLSKVEGWPMQVALFVDRKKGLDYVAVNLACGAGCMCNRFDVLAAPAMTSVRDTVFPSDRAITDALARKGVREPHQIDLPAKGTTIRLLEEGTTRQLLAVTWDGAGRFHLPSE